MFMIVVLNIFAQNSDAQIDTVENTYMEIGDFVVGNHRVPVDERNDTLLYFDYDKAAIRPEFLVLISTHAKLLAKYPNLKMRL